MGEEIEQNQQDEQNRQEAEFVPLTRYLMHVVCLSDKVVKPARRLVMNLLNDEDKDLGGIYKKMKVGAGYKISTSPAARGALEKKLEEHGLLIVREKRENYRKSQKPVENYTEKVHIPTSSEFIRLPLSPLNKVSPDSQDIVIEGKTFRLSASALSEANNSQYLGMLGVQESGLRDRLTSYIRACISSKGANNVQNRDLITYYDQKEKIYADFRFVFDVITSITIRKR